MNSHTHRRLTRQAYFDDLNESTWAGERHPVLYGAGAVDDVAAAAAAAAEAAANAARNGDDGGDGGEGTSGAGAGAAAADPEAGDDAVAKPGTNFKYVQKMLCGAREKAVEGGGSDDVKKIKNWVPKKTFQEDKGWYVVAVDFWYFFHFKASPSPRETVIV